MDEEMPDLTESPDVMITAAGNLTDDATTLIQMHFVVACNVTQSLYEGR